MKTTSSIALAAALMTSTSLAQFADANGNYVIGGITITPDAVSCLTSCVTDVQSLVNRTTFVTCGNQVNVDRVYTCISNSDCGNDNQPKASALVSSICALGTSAASVAGLTSTTASASATGSDTPTITPAPDDTSFFGPGGFFAADGAGAVWAQNFAAENPNWSTGPWTNWFGQNGCPDSTWSGWTSGSWTDSPAWTSWEGCSATTTATSLVTTTLTTDGSTTVATTTDFGVEVAAVTDGTTSGNDTATGTDEASASATGDSAGSSLRVAGAGAALSALGALFLLF